MLIQVLALVGLIGLIAGVFAWRYVRRLSRASVLPARWRHFRIAAIALGLLLASGSYFAGYYPYSTSQGVGRVVGVPFMVAFFDGAGRDYVGPLTLPAAIGNFVVWFLLPQIALALYGWDKVGSESLSQLP